MLLDFVGNAVEGLASTFGCAGSSALKEFPLLKNSMFLVIALISSPTTFPSSLLFLKNLVSVALIFKVFARPLISSTLTETKTIS
jgi:hypothetical protein